MNVTGFNHISIPLRVFQLFSVVRQLRLFFKDATTDPWGVVINISKHPQHSSINRVELSKQRFIIVLPRLHDKIGLGSLLCQVYMIYLFIYLGFLRRFQHCTGHITTGSWKGRGNQYIQFIRDLYCKLQTNGKQLPAFPLEAMTGIEPQPQRWEARVLPLCHHGPSGLYES